jgi:hypothetical protein
LYCSAIHAHILLHQSFKYPCSSTFLPLHIVALTAVAVLLLPAASGSVGVRLSADVQLAVDVSAAAAV